MAAAAVSLPHHIAYTTDDPIIATPSIVQRRWQPNPTSFDNDDDPPVPAPSDDDDDDLHHPQQQWWQGGMSPAGPGYSPISPNAYSPMSPYVPQSPYAGATSPFGTLPLYDQSRGATSPMPVTSPALRMPADIPAGIPSDQQRLIFVGNSLRTGIPFPTTTSRRSPPSTLFSVSVMVCRSSDHPRGGVL